MPPSDEPRLPTPISRARPRALPRPDAAAREASRARRLRELRQAIADGTYQPDADEIARELLEQGF